MDETKNKNEHETKEVGNIRQQRQEIEDFATEFGLTTRTSDKSHNKGHSEAEKIYLK